MSELPLIPADRFAEWRFLVRGQRHFLVSASRRTQAFEVRAFTKLEPGSYEVVHVSRRRCVVRTSSGLVSVLI